MKRGDDDDFEEDDDFEDDDDFEELHAIAEESPAEADLDTSVGAARVDASSNGAGASHWVATASLVYQFDALEMGR